MKKIVLPLILILFGTTILSGCSKDEILNHYNNIVQSAGSIELTGKSSLQGEKEKGIDDYTAKTISLRRAPLTMAVFLPMTAIWRFTRLFIRALTLPSS